MEWFSARVSTGEVSTHCISSSLKLHRYQYCPGNLYPVYVRQHHHHDHHHHHLKFANHSNINCVHVPSGLGQTQATFDIAMGQVWVMLVVLLVIKMVVNMVIKLPSWKIYGNLQIGMDLRLRDMAQEPGSRFLEKTRMTSGRICLLSSRKIQTQTQASKRWNAFIIFLHQSIRQR